MWSNSQGWEHRPYRMPGTCSGQYGIYSIQSDSLHMPKRRLKFPFALNVVDVLYGPRSFGGLSFTSGGSDALCLAATMRETVDRITPGKLHALGQARNSEE